MNVLHNNNFKPVHARVSNAFNGLPSHLQQLLSYYYFLQYLPNRPIDPFLNQVQYKAHDFLY